MSDFIETVIEKVSAYNIFHYLFPGAVFTATIQATAGYSLLSDNILVDIIVVYFCGMVLNRIGSLIVEPLCRRTGLLKYSDYADFVAAEKRDPKLAVLLQDNNTYRTLTALFLSVLAIKLERSIQSWFPELDRYIAWAWPIALLILFVLSYKKQTAYIVKRVDAEKG